MRLGVAPHANALEKRPCCFLCSHHVPQHSARRRLGSGVRAIKSPHTTPTPSRLRHVVAHSNKVSPRGTSPSLSLTRAARWHASVGLCPSSRFYAYFYAGTTGHRRKPAGQLKQTAFCRRRPAAGCLECLKQGPIGFVLVGESPTLPRNGNSGVPQQGGTPMDEARSPKIGPPKFIFCR